MVQGQRRRVEFINQRVQAIALNFRNRSKKKVSAKGLNALPILEHQYRE